MHSVVFSLLTAENFNKDFYISNYSLKSSKMIAHQENCPPTVKLTLTVIQTLTLIRGKFSSGAIVRIPVSKFYIVVATRVLLIYSFIHLLIYLFLNMYVHLSS